mmetsp:Transcript_51198/g.101699  ORF Transcript_51198/g.101699 Transcript_51198/m.101699 type:complete len:244 (-) Transcript_51198:141-872(-)
MPPHAASANVVLGFCSASSPRVAFTLLAMAILGVEQGAAEHPRFPVSWGQPPRKEVLGRVQDNVPLAGGYGFGSSALSAWILRNIERDQKARDVHFPPAFGKPPPERWCLDCGPGLLPRLGKLPFGYGYGYSAEAKSRWLIEKAREVYGEDVGAYEDAVAASSIAATTTPATTTATATTATTTTATTTTTTTCYRGCPRQSPASLPRWPPSSSTATACTTNRSRWSCGQTDASGHRDETPGPV